MRFRLNPVLVLLATLAAPPLAAAQESGGADEFGPILESGSEPLEETSTVPS